MEERLRFILSLVNDWLKFAEAKNGVLLAVDLGILAALFGAIDGTLLPKVAAFFSIALIFLAAIAILASFIPILGLRSKVGAIRTQPQASNLLFFSHIAEFEPNNYVKELYRKISQDTPIISPIETDYAGQIIANSRIALTKYRFFNIGLSLSVSALIVIVGGGIYGLLTN